MTFSNLKTVLTTFFFFLVLTLFSSASVEADAVVRSSLDLVDHSLTAPEVPYQRNYIIFTAEDENGIKQVYYQYINSTTAADATSPTVQLTFNSVDASYPKFGTDRANITYHPTKNSPPEDLLQCEGMLFYYIADVNQDSINEIRLGCIETPSLETETPNIIFDAALTGYDSATNFAVNNLDTVQFNAPTTIIYYSASYNSDLATSYPVVFTDKSGDLHMLMHRSDRLYGDDGNLSASEPNIVYDYTDPAGVYKWDASVINKNNTITSPKLDFWGNNVVYAIRKDSTNYFQLGTISITGKKQFMITEYTKNVLNPRFHENGYRDSTSTMRDGYHVFFELEEDGTDKNQLMYLRFHHYILGGLEWCNTAGLISDPSRNHQNLRTSYGSNSATFSPTLLTYEKVQDDKQSDIYLSTIDVDNNNYCDGSVTRGDGTTIEMVNANSGTQVKQNYDIAYLTTAEIQLTCQNSNSHPVFLPTLYHDEDFNEVTSSQDFLDVVFIRKMADATGNTYGQVYNTEESTGECQDTCYENSDGSPIVDSNGVQDGDGIADSCENLTCVEQIRADFGSDVDFDNIANYEDNCPCDYNPNQDDSDNDGWGDTCDIEANECGTMDNDGDGVNDGCDQCPNHADTFVLNYDIDGDGIMDSCVAPSETTTTGETITTTIEQNPVINSTEQDEPVNNDPIEEDNPDESFSIDGGFMTSSGTLCSLNKNIQSGSNAHMLSLFALTAFILATLSYRKKKTQKDS